MDNVQETQGRRCSARLQSRKPEYDHRLLTYGHRPFTVASLNVSPTKLPEKQKNPRKKKVNTRGEKENAPLDTNDVERLNTIDEKSVVAPQEPFSTHPLTSGVVHSNEVTSGLTSCPADDNQATQAVRDAGNESELSDFSEELMALVSSTPNKCLQRHQDRNRSLTFSYTPSVFHPFSSHSLEDSQVFDDVGIGSNHQFQLRPVPSNGFSSAIANELRPPSTDNNYNGRTGYSAVKSSTIICSGIQKLAQYASSEGEEEADDDDENELEIARRAKTNDSAPFNRMSYRPSGMLNSQANEDDGDEEWRPELDAETTEDEEEDEEEEEEDFSGFDADVAPNYQDTFLADENSEAEVQYENAGEYSNEYIDIHEGSEDEDEDEDNVMGRTTGRTLQAARRVPNAHVQAVNRVDKGKGKAPATNAMDGATGRTIRAVGGVPNTSVQAVDRVDKGKGKAPATHAGDVAHIDFLAGGADATAESVWRSPRKNAKTLITDFLGGVRRADLTQEDLVKIAISLQQRLRSCRRPDVKAKLQALLNDPEIAAVLQEVENKAQTNNEQPKCRALKGTKKTQTTAPKGAKKQPRVKTVTVPPRANDAPVDDKIVEDIAEQHLLKKGIIFRQATKSNHEGSSHHEPSSSKDPRRQPTPTQVAEGVARHFQPAQIHLLPRNGNEASEVPRTGGVSIPSRTPDVRPLALDGRHEVAIGVSIGSGAAMSSHIPQGRPYSRDDGRAPGAPGSARFLQQPRDVPRAGGASAHLQTPLGHSLARNEHVGTSGAPGSVRFLEIRPGQTSIRDRYDERRDTDVPRASGAQSSQPSQGHAFAHNDQYTGVPRTGGTSQTHSFPRDEVDAGRTPGGSRNVRFTQLSGGHSSTRDEYGEALDIGVPNTGGPHASRFTQPPQGHAPRPSQPSRTQGAPRTGGSHKPSHAHPVPHDDGGDIQMQVLNLDGGAIGSFGRALQSSQVQMNPFDVQKTGKKRARSNVPETDHEVDDRDMERTAQMTTTKKRKSRARKARKARKVEDEDAETFNIEDSEPDDGPQSHNLKYYKGMEKKVVDIALFYFRLYLLNINAFPDADEITTWSTNAFTAACKSIYGVDFQSHLADYTDGVARLIQRETWGVRGRIKKNVIRLIHTYYRILPAPYAYADFPNPKSQEKAHIMGRVKQLLEGENSPFIYGPLEPHGPSVAYGHSAIREFIHSTVFCKQSSRRPLAMRDLNAFDPIPLPLIALVVTALLHALEEYQTGVHETLDFSSSAYHDFYRKALRNLRSIESSKILGPDLERVRRHIFRTGRELLYGDADVRPGRPTLAFVPDGQLDEVGEDEYY